MKKTFYCILALILFSFLPVPGRNLVEIVSNGNVSDLSVTWPFWRYLFEPFFGSAEYILSFSRYVIQMFSWIFWLGMITLTWGIYRGKTFKEIMLGISLSWVTFLSIIIFSVLFITPAPRLKTAFDSIVVDFHSHTNYSHDAISGIGQSQRYHEKLGFNSYFITEHGHTWSYPDFPEKEKFVSVFPGMQVQTKERISLLVLADEVFSGDDFIHKTIKDVIDTAHSRGYVVICPHWWKWKYPPVNELLSAGIDGFEVYNAGYRNISEPDRTALINFCRNNDLFMSGSTDWHGWGSMSNVWTVMEIRKDNIDLKTAIFSDLREHRQPRIIVYGREESNSNIRYIFEPFVGVFYYFGSLDFYQIAGWILWLVILGFVISVTHLLYLSRVLSLLMGIIFFFMAVYYIIAWIPLLPENQILGKLLAPILFVIGSGWLALYMNSEKE